MIIDLHERPQAERYRLMSQIVVPRPIAWVATLSTVADKTITNLAPFSYFTPLSSSPPTVMISIGHRPDGRPKDTLRNLRESGRCTIGIISPDQVTPMHNTGQSFEPDQSEPEHLDIPMRDVIADYPPMPTELTIALFGTYLQEVELEGSKTIPVIIEIDHIYIDETLISDPDTLELSFDALARMSQTYRTLGKIVTP
jgi:flavin reductase (DIM6/NTAB) family NADH-FMN oxidoreductase RutF